jgi:hypothetical protein
MAKNHRLNITNGGFFTDSQMAEYLEVGCIANGSSSIVQEAMLNTARLLEQIGNLANGRLFDSLAAVFTPTVTPIGYEPEEASANHMVFDIGA